MSELLRTRVRLPHGPRKIRPSKGVSERALRTLLDLRLLLGGSVPRWEPLGMMSLFEALIWGLIKAPSGNSWE